MKIANYGLVNDVWQESQPPRTQLQSVYFLVYKFLRSTNVASHAIDVTFTSIAINMMSNHVKVAYIVI